MTNPIPWQRLRELAEKAVPGPWKWDTKKTDKWSVNGPDSFAFTAVSAKGRREPVAIVVAQAFPADEDSELVSTAKFIAALDPATVLQMVAEHAAVREALERARGCIKDLLGLHDAVFDEGVFGFDEGCGEELCGASLCEECGCVADKVDAARAALTGVEHERLAND